MSVEAMALVLHHSKASGTPKVVLVGIANHDGDGGAWPTIATLCKYTNRAESTVQEALAALEAAGEITIHRNAGGNADTRPDRRPNRYEILLRCPDDCDGSTQHRVQDSGPRETGPNDARGPGSRADGVQDSGPEPSLEPSCKTPEPDGSASSRGSSPDSRGGGTRSGRKRRTSPEADAITRAWWETLERKPVGERAYVSIRQVVQSALNAKWTAEEIARGLADIANDPPVMMPKLERAMRTRRKRYDPSGLNA